MNSITYTRHGDYFLPDIILREPPPGVLPPLGKYAQIRQRFLKEHKPAFYATLLLSERLYPHLRDVDEAVAQRMSAIAGKLPAEEIINEILFE